MWEISGRGYLRTKTRRQKVRMRFEGNDFRIVKLIDSFDIDELTYQLLE
jgi:hypothetical protein